jgi:Tol biopolymer transport system component
VEQPEVSIRFDSWKDIAAYLDRDVRTVMRWEKARALPVRRIPGQARSTVYAYKAEIDAWMRGQPDVVGLEDLDTSVFPSSGSPTGGLPETAHGKTKKFGWLTAAVIVAAVVLCAGLTAFAPWQSAPSLTASNPVRITQSQNRILSPLLSESDAVYFPQYENGHYSIGAVPAGGGQSVTVTTTVPNPDLCDIATHSRSILLRSVIRYRDDAGPLYVQPALSPAQRVGNISVNDVVWYPDERRILYSADQAVYMTDQTGKTPQQLFEAPGIAFWFRWGSDGKTLRYTVLDKNNHLSLWQTQVDVGASRGADKPHRLFSNISADLCCGTWTPDGSHFLFQYRVGSVFQMWAQREASSALRFWNSKPFPLLTGPISYRGAAISPDSQRLYLRTESAKAELMRFDRATGKFLPFLPSLPVRTLAFSRDGTQLAYTSLADDQLWRCRADGQQCVQLTKNLKKAILPRWSPDGRSIALMSLQDGGGWAVMLVPTQGGDVRTLSNLTRSQGYPDWSNDGRRLVFSDVLPTPHQGGVYMVEVSTGNVEKLPASNDFTSPRWSQDGRFLAALHVGDQHLFLFDFKQARWTELTTIGGDYPTWSHDGKSVLFMAVGDPSRQVYRVDVADVPPENSTI